MRSVAARPGGLNRTPCSFGSVVASTSERSGASGPPVLSLPLAGVRIERYEGEGAFHGHALGNSRERVGAECCDGGRLREGGVASRSSTPMEAATG